MVTEKYKTLIDQFPLIPIRCDEDLNKAHKVAQSLMLRSEAMAPDECDYLEVLLDEIGKFEKKSHALKFEELNPHELLQSFIKDHGLKQVDMQAILGVTSSGVMSELVSGKRALTRDHCVRLGSLQCIARAISAENFRIKRISEVLRFHNLQELN